VPRSKADNGASHQAGKVEGEAAAAGGAGSLGQEQPSRCSRAASRTRLAEQRAGALGRGTGPGVQDAAGGGAVAAGVAELPELFQLKCLSPALEARLHLNRNNPSIPRIQSDTATDRIKYHNLPRW
jgi:hypothetical protein